MKSSFSHSRNASAATLAFISFAYFVIAVVALYLLNPSYGLAVSMYGGYDLGSYEFLIASTFFALGIGSLALGAGLAEAMSPSLRSWLGLLLLGIWGIGIFLAGVFPANDGGSTVPHLTTVLIAGIFPVQVEATPETKYSFMHIFTILGSFFMLAIASVLLSWKFKQYERWRSFPSISLILTLLMLVLALFFIPTFLFPGLLGYTTFNAGFFVLLGIHIGILWLILTAVWLRFVVKGSVGRS
jgi:hypothetical protein